ncbi:SMP-30/gluconolactonase/LRE family protein [Cellvibrio fibrivorans]|uniref:Sugar lactone lactonase YvrE n=1 Tax=Cellvibrio fibrivorans TaxID=126350 RepID=A0ABU1UT15_9GAMM|nr:SMP-30/gluconolactonase/LRE family protein [Cellvibrio fibrivorans]MDR7088322.1 sugar lactone lactonase YvrE [Cellvibrio fibrivorans]
MNNMRLNPRYLIAAALFASAPCTIAQTKDYVADNVFTQGIEGPAVDAQGNLYAVSFGKDGTIGVIDEKDNAQLFVTLPEGSTGNGIRFDRDGFMYVADYSGHNVLKIDPKTKAIFVHAHSEKMNQPNDIAIAKSGVIYASDPNWKESTGNLWKVATDGTVTLLEANMGTTNGVEVSTDEKHLYVNESVQRNVWKYDIDKTTGAVKNKRLLIQFPDHGLDGMRCDVDGNLYIARYAAGEVTVVSPHGTVIERIKLKGQKPTNVAFGGVDGKTVYVTLQERGAIETFRSERAGREWQLQQ